MRFGECEAKKPIFDGRYPTLSARRMPFAFADGFLYAVELLNSKDWCSIKSRCRYIEPKNNKLPTMHIAKPFRPLSVCFAP